MLLSSPSQLKARQGLTPCIHVLLKDLSADRQQLHHIQSGQDIFTVNLQLLHVAYFVDLHHLHDIV